MLTAPTSETRSAARARAWPCAAKLAGAMNRRTAASGGVTAAGTSESEKRRPGGRNHTVSASGNASRVRR